MPFLSLASGVEWLVARYKNRLLSGSQYGQRLVLCTPSLRRVTGRGVPPAEGTATITDCGIGVKRISPLSPQLAPRPFSASAIVRTGPPSMGAFFSFASAKNPTHFPSGDQNG